MEAVTDTSVPPAPQPPPPAVGSVPVAPPPYAGAGVGPSVSLHRTAAVERAAVVLVAIAAAFALLRIPVARQVRGDARLYLDGELPGDDLLEEAAPVVVVTIVQLLAVLAAAILVIVWMYRLADNHRLLRRGTRWSPGWAIGAWFLPPLLYIIPTLVFVELWKSSDPDVPPTDGDRWRTGAVSPLIPVWFVAYSIIPIVLTIVPGSGPVASLSGSEDQLAEALTDGQTVANLGAAANAASAIVFILMARGLGARHRRLTGEDRD